MNKLFKCCGEKESLFTLSLGNTKSVMLPCSRSNWCWRSSNCTLSFPLAIFKTDSCICHFIHTNWVIGAMLLSSNTFLHFFPPCINLFQIFCWTIPPLIITMLHCRDAINHLILSHCNYSRALLKILNKQYHIHAHTSELYRAYTLNKTTY